MCLLSYISYYLTFSKAIVSTADIIPTIQNLVTILASGIGSEFCPRSAGMPSFWK